MQRVFWLWRMFATALAYSLFGLGGVLVPPIAGVFLLLLPGGKAKRQRRARYLVHCLFKAFIYMMRALGLLRWRTQGMELLSRDGLLVLANHPTLLDVVFLVAFIPNASCIVKSRLLANPAMRGFIALTGYIANDDGQGLVSAARDAMASGSNLIVFPEGTRTRPGKAIAMQRGAANIAVRCGTDVTPVIISCLPPTLSKEDKWYHIPSRPFVMSFTVNKDICVACFSEKSAVHGARQLTQYLENYFTKETQHHG